MDRQFAATQEESLSSINEILSDVRDLLVGIYIQNLRIYDMLTISATQINETQTDELIDRHAIGEVLCPEPILKQSE